jgi:4a-hydroxytetrahydrobiopterin dehydratase
VSERRTPGKQEEQMAGELRDRSCVPCSGGLPALDAGAALRLRADVPAWTLKEGPSRIAREWRFGDFAAAFAFVRKVAELAEAEGHHPDIRFGWGYAQIEVHTHAIGGLHENDFILAAKIDALDGGN